MHTKLCLSLGLLTLAFAPLTHPLPAQAQTAAPQTITKPTLTVLHSFTGGDGQYCQAPLTVGADGSLYGVASQGGAQNNNGGTVFKVTQGGVFHKLANLYGQNGADPQGPLLLMPDGALMGSTVVGGAGHTGSLFLLTPPHRFQTKHEFSPFNAQYQNAHGAYPSGALVLGNDGAVYGTTAYGGASGYGVVYRWTAVRGVEVVHDFVDAAQGTYPGGLTLGPDGVLYGSTGEGGANNDGIVYSLTTDGIFTPLYSFTAADGGGSDTPVFGVDGALYSTTFYGGANQNGTFYRITTGGAFTLVHSFTEAEKYFQSRLTPGPDGNFYGTDQGSRAALNGSVFRLTPAGVLTVLYAFKKGSTGYDPQSGVVFGPDGALYGTTSLSGLYGHGVAFKLRLP